MEVFDYQRFKLLLTIFFWRFLKKFNFFAPYTYSSKNYSILKKEKKKRTKGKEKF